MRGGEGDAQIFEEWHCWGFCEGLPVLRLAEFEPNLTDGFGVSFRNIPNTPCNHAPPEHLSTNHIFLKCLLVNRSLA